MILGDSEIRIALQLRLRKKNPSSIILNELKVCNGRSIVDLAVLGDSFHGFEIKSDKDTLNRLPAQIIDYNKVFDYMTIVLGKVHHEKALDILPGWWSVWLAEIEGEKIKLKEVRKGKRNKAIDSFSLSQFLWREEAVMLMHREGIMDGMRNKRKWLLWDKIATSLPLESIYAHVKLTLADRYQNSEWKN